MLLYKTEGNGHLRCRVEVSARQFHILLIHFFFGSHLFRVFSLRLGTYDAYPSYKYMLLEHMHPSHPLFLMLCFSPCLFSYIQCVGTVRYILLDQYLSYLAHLAS